eukprot:2927456-Amphidinium_carterae.1
MLKIPGENGHALKYAAEELKSDRKVVSKAVAQNRLALKHAADVLLEDESFEGDARYELYLFK